MKKNKVASSRKNKPTKEKKEVDCLDFGLEPGKLYSFNGKFRLLYPEKKNCPSKPKDRYKIIKGDRLLYLGGELTEAIWPMSYSVLSYVQEKQLIKREEMILARKKLKLYRVVQSPWPNMYYIYFTSDVPVYKGRIRVAYKDTFGWVNISMLNKQQIMKQFTYIDPEVEKNNL